MSQFATNRQLLEELEARQDEVLRELEELDRQILQVLALATGPSLNAPSTPEPARL